MRFLLDAVVPGTVEFDDQTMLDAQKIDDETSDRNLPSKFQTIEAAAAQVAPENDLGGRHIAAKAPSERGLSGADASGHGSWSDAGAFPARASRRRGPSSDPCFARATFSRGREKEGASGREPSPLVAYPHGARTNSSLDYFPILCFNPPSLSAEDASGAVLMCGRGAALALCGNTDPRTRVRLCEAGRDQKRLARPGPAARPGAIRSQARLTVNKRLAAKACAPKTAVRTQSGARRRRRRVGTDVAGT